MTRRLLINKQIMRDFKIMFSVTRPLSVSPFVSRPLALSLRINTIIKVVRSDRTQNGSEINLCLDSVNVLLHLTSVCFASFFSIPLSSVLSGLSTLPSGRFKELQRPITTKQSSETREVFITIIIIIIRK